MRRPDDQDDPARRLRDLRERALRRPHEAGPQEEVLGRVAGDGELGEDRDVRAGLPRLLEPVEDEGAVAVEIADGGIDLGESEAHSFRLGV